MQALCRSHQAPLFAPHLLVSDQHAAVVELGEQALVVGHKLGADVAAVDVHTLLHLHHGVRAVNKGKQTSL